MTELEIEAALNDKRNDQEDLWTSISDAEMLVEEAEERLRRCRSRMLRLEAEIAELERTEASDV